MIRIFQILAVILAGIAAYFLWADNWDGTFIAVVLAISSFFLSMRFQIKARMAGRAADQSELEELDEQ